MTEIKSMNLTVRFKSHYLRNIENFIELFINIGSI